MFRIKEDFRQGAPISTIPAEWFNQVARFLNHMVGDGIQVKKPDFPSVNNPVKILPAPNQGITPAPVGESFPWGAQWVFGLTKSGAYITIHNPVLYLSTALVTAPETTIAPAVDTLAYIALSLDTLTASIATAQQTAAEIVAGGGYGVVNIPLFRFNQTTLVTDYIHGMPMPTLWTPSIAESNG